jgi:hypothetical protein
VKIFIWLRIYTILILYITSRNARRCSSRLAEKIPGAVRVDHRISLDVVEKRNTFPRQRLANHVPGATVIIRLPHCWGVARDSIRNYGTGEINNGIVARCLATGVWVSEWITTDGRSVSLSWCRAPSGARDQILITIWLFLFVFFSMSVAPSDERSGLSFVLVTRTQSQSHVTTDDQSVSKSWIRAPCGSRDRTLISVWHLRILFYRLRAPPLTRGRVCHLS